PLDDVPPPIYLPVEVRVARLILAGRDHRLDVPPPRPAAHVGIAVPLVSRRLLRPARPASAARPPRPAHHRLEGLALVALPGGQPDGQDDALAVAGQVNLGAEAAARAAQAVVRRLSKMRGRGA